MEDFFALVDTGEIRGGADITVVERTRIGIGIVRYVWNWKFVFVFLYILYLWILLYLFFFCFLDWDGFFKSWNVSFVNDNSNIGKCF